MADYDVTTDMTLEQAITAGSVGADDEITILEGAVLTCDETPSILMDKLWIEDGELYIDGENISTGNMINWVGKHVEYISTQGKGTLTIRGKWFDIGTTDGTNSQVIDLSSTTGAADYWDGDFCVDVIPMIQIETGRRINFNNSTGTAPEVDDWVNLTSNKSVIGRIIQVEATYLIVRFLIGSLVDDDEIQVRKVVDNDGPDYQVSWTADVNHASGDILEAGVYQEFGNSRSNGNSCISYFHHGVGGFVFDNEYQSTNITMGTTAGVTGGFVPPSGCNIRVPNVHMSTSDATHYALGQTYHDGSDYETRWYELGGNTGVYDISVFNAGISYWATSFAYSFDAEYMGACIAIGNRSSASKTTFSHCVRVADPVARATGYGYAFQTLTLAKGAIITDCMSIAGEEELSRIGGDGCSDLTITGCISSIAASASWSSYNYNYAFFNCKDVVFKNNVAVNGQDNTDNWSQLNLESVTNFHAEMYRWSVCQMGTPKINKNSRTQIQIDRSVNVYIEGLEWIDTGYGDYNVVNISDSNDVKIRCLGMIDDKVPVGTVQERFYSAREWSWNIEISRIWLSGGYLTYGFPVGDNVPKNLIAQNCSGKYDAEIQLFGSDNYRFKGMHGANGTPNASDGWESAVPTFYGLNFHDFFRSDTVGEIVCTMIAPGQDGPFEYEFITGTPVFDRTGKLNMLSGDVIEFTMNYFAKGHNSFPGTFTTSRSTSAWNADEWTNIDIDFQWMLDGGAWNGTWLDIRTASNLTSISGDIAGGIKFKYRCTATGDQTGLSAIFIDTASTIAIQKANFYPITYNTFPGATSGSVW